MNNLLQDEIYTKLMDNRIIFLNGEINDAKAVEVVSKLLYLDSLNNNDITIYINSPGGSVTSGLMIYDTIKYLKSDVSTISIGLSASMASILLMAGTKGKRKILPHSKVMLHEPSTKTDGKVTDVLIAANQLKETRDILSTIIINNSSLTQKQVEKELEKDFWLNCQEALKYGIVDKIIEIY